MTVPMHPVPPKGSSNASSAGRILAMLAALVALAALACCACTGGALVASWLMAGPGLDARETLNRMRGGDENEAAVTAGGGEGEPGGEDSRATADESRRGGTLRLPGGDPTTLDPALVGDVTSAEYIYEVFSGLVTLSPDLEVVPDLAREWALSPDGTVYTFTLHDDAVFHDGTPVGASAIQDAIERACDAQTASAVAETYLGDIVGCSDKLSGRAADVDGVRVLDDGRLEITIDEPKAYFLAKLTYPSSFAIDSDQLQSDPDWLLHPNGTGPFRLESYEEGDHLQLARHERYYGERAQLDTVRFDLRPIDPLTRYENGELDATPVSSADIDRVSDPLNPLSDELVDGPGDLDLQYVGFNVNVPPFDDKNVRRAFSLALDKRRLAAVVLHGAVQPVNTILPPGMPGHDPRLDPYPFDPAAARAALAASRYGSGEAFPPVTLDVPGEGGAPIAEAVADYLAETLRLDITVELTPWDEYQRELDAHEFDMFMLGWSADYPDPQDFLDVLFHSKSALNHTGYANDDVDAMLEEARVETDENTRLALYRQAERQILEDAPWLPVFTGLNTWLVAPYVHGFIQPAIVQPRLAAVRVDPS